MGHNDKRSHRQMIRLLASVGIVSAACLLMSCQGADNDVDLTILEWSGYQHPQYHPEFNAKYGGQPDVALFAEEKNAMQRMRNGYRARAKALQSVQRQSLSGEGDKVDKRRPRLRRRLSNKL